LWGQLARDTDEDLWVRIEAFSKAFDQLVCDQELCCKVVHDCIAEIKKHERHSTGKEINILVRIAAHVPGTIRQFWAQIESACHDDCPNSRHWDVSSVGDNCSHGDDYGAAPHHRDRLDSHWLRRFPAAARR
jgi:hypothetical protein